MDTPLQHRSAPAGSRCRLAGVGVGLLGTALAAVAANAAGVSPGLAVAIAAVAALLAAPLVLLSPLCAAGRRTGAADGMRRGLHGLRGSASVHRRVRLALYAVLLAAGVHAAFQSWQAERWHAARARDARIADLAGAQRMLSQRIARLASQIQADPAGLTVHEHDLREALLRSAAGARELEERLPPDLDAPGALPLREAVTAWRRVQQRMVLRAQSLLDRLALGQPAGLAGPVSELQAEADPALLAAQGLVEALQLAALERGAADLGQSHRWSLLTTLLVVALGIAVAETTARSVRSQYRRLNAQARELERLALVAELTSNAVLITDATQRIVWANDAFSRITGYSLQEALGQRPARLLSDERVDRATLARIGAAVDAGQGLRAQFLNRRKDGSDLWLDLDIQPLRDDDGRLSGFVDVFSDITERRRAQAELRLAAIAFDSLEAIAITDARQVILKVNRAFTRITGYAEHEAVGQVTGRLLRSGRHDAEFYAAMWRSLNSHRHWQGEIWNRRKDGQVYPQWLGITAVADEDGRVTNYVAVFSDITQKKQADETIHQLAFYDPLTELPNRRLLRERLGQTLSFSARHPLRAAVLFIDIDHFKELNDTRGHDVGDQLLVAVAQRLTACVRSTDTVARQGGDEFVIILDGLDEQPDKAAVQAETVAEKVRDALSRPFHLDGHEWHGTPSIGISLFGGGQTTAEEVLKCADTAMYEAKRSGRNAIRFFDPATHAAMAERVALEADLRRALAAGQFALHYQPQVDRGARVRGAEVLLRWMHPQRGMVPPGHFIPLAEQTDLILSIGQWVLRTACDQLRAWQDDPRTRDLQLSVNVSARQFRQADFVDELRSVVQASGADPRRLKLELTESLVLLNVVDTVAKMHAVRNMGIRFSIDDFGTGQSSLAYLTRLPLDQLKIDQSFVRNMLVAHTDAVIVQAIIGMAQNLGLEVIAEGVETHEQRAFLEACGCASFQGYLFGRPVPLAEFERSLSPDAQYFPTEEAALRLRASSQLEMRLETSRPGPAAD